MSKFDQDHRPLSPLQLTVTKRLIGRAIANNQLNELGLAPDSPLYSLYLTNHMPDLDTLLQEREAVLVREFMAESVPSFSIDEIVARAHRQVYEQERPRYEMVSALEEELEARADSMRELVTTYKNTHRHFLRRNGTAEVSSAGEYTIESGVVCNFSWQRKKGASQDIVPKHFELQLHHYEYWKDHQPIVLRFNFDRLGAIQSLELEATKAGVNGLIANPKTALLGEMLYRLQLSSFMFDSGDSKIGLQMNFSHSAGEIPTMNTYMSETIGRLRKRTTREPLSRFDIPVIFYNNDKEQFDGLWYQINFRHGKKTRELNFDTYQQLFRQIMDLQPAARN